MPPTLVPSRSVGSVVAIKCFLIVDLQLHEARNFIQIVSHQNGTFSYIFFRL